MAALVVPGAPVSVLIDHGLPEKIVEKLLEGGIPTVEKLGDMTPEQLEEIPGIGPKLVEKIQDAVVSYYGQFEQASDAPQTDESQEQHPTEDLGYVPASDMVEMETDDQEPANEIDPESVPANESTAITEEASLERASSLGPDFANEGAENTESARIIDADRSVGDENPPE